MEKAIIEKGLTVLRWLSERLGSSSKYTTKLEVVGDGESDLKEWQFRNYWNIYISFRTTEVIILKWLTMTSFFYFSYMTKHTFSWKYSRVEI